MEIVLLLDSINIGSWTSDQVRVEFEIDPERLLEDFDVEDRVKGLDPHEVITAVGISKALNALDEAELTEWIRGSEIDPTDLLNALGEEAIFEWVNSHGE